VASFRKLSAVELARLKPLRIRVVTAAAGDNEDSFARRMRGVERPRELFRALNDLNPGERIAPGTKVKIVAD
jgi:predicted Zn-dependent protease